MVRSLAVHRVRGHEDTIGRGTQSIKRIGAVGPPGLEARHSLCARRE
jgi:hypothetical protein